MFEDISKVILLSDMDGTLLNGKKQITDIDRAAIKRFTELGGKFTVATGREKRCSPDRCRRSAGT